MFGFSHGLAVHKGRLWCFSQPITSHCINHSWSHPVEKTVNVAQRVHTSLAGEEPRFLEACLKAQLLPVNKPPGFLRPSEQACDYEPCHLHEIAAFLILQKWIIHGSVHHHSCLQILWRPRAPWVPREQGPTRTQTVPATLLRFLLALQLVIQYLLIESFLVESAVGPSPYT